MILRGGNDSWTAVVRQLLVGTVIIGVLVSPPLLLISQLLVSPNKLIAYTSDLSGNSEIYVMDVNRGLAFNLTRHPADDFGPAWSPRAHQIAFFSDRDGNLSSEIYLMNSDGSDIHPITAGEDNDWRPEWSPDGDQIVFIRNYGNISVMDADGGNEHDLTYGFGPAWSPTDARIVYYADRPDDSNADIFVLDTDGRNLRTLSENRAHDWDPAWSPDGQQIAFVSSRDGDAEIYVACAGACDASTRRLTHHAGIDRAPAWSPDGQQLAFESEIDGVPIIFVVNRDGTSLVPLRAGRSPVWLDTLDK